MPISSVAPDVTHRSVGESRQHALGLEGRVNPVVAPEAVEESA